MTTGVKNMKRLRFTVEDDLTLLREVAMRNPLENNAMWETVRQNVKDMSGKNFTIKSLKSHLFLLLEIWLRKGNKMKSAGLQEVYYSEWDNLLHTINEISIKINLSEKIKRLKGTVNKSAQTIDFDTKATNLCEIKSSPQHSASEESFDGRFDSTYYVNNDIELQSEVTVEDPEAQNMEQPMKNVIETSSLEFIQNNNEKHNVRKRELDLEEKKLQLEEKKLMLEERKLALEERRQDITEHYRKEKLEMERQRIKQEILERNQTSKIIEQQQKLIDCLMKKAL